MSRLSAQDAQQFNPQTASGLFRCPLEIRRAIYSNLISAPGMHVVCDDTGNFGLSPCVGPDLYAGHIGEERCSEPDAPDHIRYADQLWLRRLVSSWGPHWQCEEVALNMKRSRDEEKTIAKHSNYALLGICKRIRLELVDFMANTVPFHVTDLRAIGGLLDALYTSSQLRPSVLPGFQDTIWPNLTRLSITLSVPWLFFQGLDPSFVHDGYAPSPAELQTELDIWSALPSGLAKLAQLRHLQVWLDHTNKPYWSRINERATLAKFEMLQASNPAISMVFILPKSHPQIEDSQRHYTEESNRVLDIRRVLRQRHRAIERSDEGRFGHWYLEDFPHLIDNPDFDHMSMDEKEELERKMWRTGEEVPKFESEYTAAYQCVLMKHFSSDYV